MNIKENFEILKKQGVLFFSRLKINRVAILIFLVVLIPLIFFILSILQKDSVNIDRNTSEDIYFDSAYVPDQLVIKLKSHYTKEELTRLQVVFAQQGAVGQQKAYISDKPYLADYYLLKFKTGTNIEKAKTIFDDTGLIEVSHPNYILEIQDKVPNDSLFSQQW